VKLKTNFNYKQLPKSGFDEGRVRKAGRFPAATDHVHSPEWGDLSLDSEVARWLSPGTYGIETTHQHRTGSRDAVIADLSLDRQSDLRQRGIVLWFLLAAVVGTSAIGFWMLWLKANAAIQGFLGFRL
jgi:hypothetical protein